MAVPMVQSYVDSSEDITWVEEKEKSESEKEKDSKDTEIEDSKICPSDYNSFIAQAHLAYTHQGLTGFGADFTTLHVPPPERA